MLDLSVIGNEHVKRGLLFSAVNTSYDVAKKDRINLLLIGDPWVGKSKLLKRTTKLVPNSRYESEENSSGKSLTGIIEKLDDNTQILGLFLINIIQL